MIKKLLCSMYLKAKHALISISEFNNVHLLDRVIYKGQDLHTLNCNDVIKELLVLVGNFKGLNYYPDICLVCYEKPCDFCHRHLVADWLNEHGFKCKEWQ